MSKHSNKILLFVSLLNALSHSFKSNILFSLGSSLESCLLRFVEETLSNVSHNEDINTLFSLKMADELPNFLDKHITTTSVK